MKHGALIKWKKIAGFRSGGNGLSLYCVTKASKVYKPPCTFGIESIANK